MTVESNNNLSNKPPAPLAEAPSSFRPDRAEVMNPVGTGSVLILDKGVSFECLVGAHNGARNLTTGFVTFEAGAVLPYHRHTSTESITLLDGTLIVEVEGRSYRLNHLDNLTIPAGASHRAECPAGSSPARAHVAMSTDSPGRELVDGPATPPIQMDDTVAGLIGPEHMVRFASAHRYEAGPNTEFVDFLNARMIPGCEMSGGYGLFHHAGRLPAHIHDFDESICIIDGSATCNVEGRVYTMNDCAVALQPRGRIHYFINDTHSPMAMLWVYAGPMPERIEISESLTQPGVDPWSENN